MFNQFEMMLFKQSEIVRFLTLQSITSIIIPEKVVVIKNYAFSECTMSWKKKTNKAISILDKVTTMLFLAFTNWVSLKSIIISEKVSKFVGKAFSNCYNLNIVYYLEVSHPSRSIFKTLVFAEIMKIDKCIISNFGVIGMILNSNSEFASVLIQLACMQIK